MGNSAGCKSRASRASAAVNKTGACLHALLRTSANKTKTTERCVCIRIYEKQDEGREKRNKAIRGGYEKSRRGSRERCIWKLPAIYC